MLSQIQMFIRIGLWLALAIDIISKYYDKNDDWFLMEQLFKSL